MTMHLPPQVQKVVDHIDAFMAKYPTVTQPELFGKLEAETGVPKALFFVPVSILVVVLLTLAGGLKLVVDLLGFLYPAYMSFKSMDSGSKDDTQWLTYWVVFGFFSIVEGVFGFLVSLIPFYYVIKAGMIVWMYYPSTMGAKVLYQQGLKPLLMPYIADGTTAKKSG